jgi:nucleoside-diphosphate-sugar epimerase
MADVLARKPRALITGAGGFTGHYLAAELAAAGHEVFGTFAAASEQRSPHVHHALACDLRDAESVRRVVQEAEPDFVANLAGISFVPHGNVEEIYSTNLVGPRHLLQALSELAAPPAMTLLVSSANIYGNASVPVIDERTPAAPTNDYAVAKLAMEYLAGLYADRLRCVTVRPFNYTGVGQSGNFLLPKIVRHVHERAPVIELGNLDVARDFSDVRSVARYYRILLQTPAVAGMTLNVCSGRAYSLREVLDMAREISGHAMDVRVNPAFVRANEVKSLHGSRELLNRYVGEPQGIPLRETLRWMLEQQA